MPRKLTKHYSVVHADKVLRELKKIWPEKWDGTISMWANGREQGYHVSAHILTDDVFGSAACVFAQQRNSDGIVVVAGKTTDFDIQTHMPSEAAWDGRQEFYDSTGLNRSIYDDPDYDTKYKGRGDRMAAEWLVAMLSTFIDQDAKENKARLEANKKAS